MDQPLFSFLYGGKPFLGAEGFRRRVTERGSGTVETVFEHTDGLAVTQTVRVFPGFHAKQWVLTFENKALIDSQPLAQICDADIVLTDYNMKPLYDEYIRVRPYLSCDFYNLAGDSLTDDAWCAWQYDRPEHGDGLLLAFRRPLAVYECARLALQGLDEHAGYELRDEDTGEVWRLTGAGLAAGWLMTIPDRRQSRLVFYRRV